MLRKKYIEPGYNTGDCSAELIEQVNCGFAKQMYARYADKKFGVQICIYDELDKYTIKKLLLDLNMIYNRHVCNLDDCEECEDLSVTPTFNPTSCPAPTDLVLSFEWVTEGCPAPLDPVATLSYQS